MAIAKCVRIRVTAVADGESTQFSCDLTVDPYWVGETTTTGAGGDITNWEPSMAADVLLISGAEGANMAGPGSPVIIIDVPIKNAGATYEVVLDVILG